MNYVSVITRMNYVLQELRAKTTIDKRRKVCKNCNELGHSIVSPICIINVNKNNLLIAKIKKCVNEENDQGFITIENLCNKISKKLNITSHLCRTLYDKIRADEIRNINVDKCIDEMYETFVKYCYECNTCIVLEHSHRIWNKNIVCELCWVKHEDERNTTWDKIHTYKPIQCIICNTIQAHKYDRFHYDHINMFDKTDTIYKMVMNGECLEDIYLEIDKCQLLCISCHQMVTKMEVILGFTRQKTILKSSKHVIPETEYNEKWELLYQSYECKMKEVYDKLKSLNRTPNSV